MAIVLLDGAIGHELKAKGIDQLCSDLGYHDLFAAGSLANEIKPNLVESIHRDYIHAGATVITTNSFGCTQSSLAKASLESKQGTLIQRACEIAIKVKESINDSKQVRIAGSIPPLGESYDGCNNFQAIRDEMAKEYDYIVTILAKNNLDILLCETMSSFQEASLASECASRCSKQDTRIWVSFTLEDTLPKDDDSSLESLCILRSGESLLTAANDLLKQHSPGSKLQAILVNCCAPEVVTAAMTVLQHVASSHPNHEILYGGYANGFKMTTTEWLASEQHALVPSLENKTRRLVRALESSSSWYDPGTGIITPDLYAKYALEWIRRGAQVIGGCCGTGPGHIAACSHLM